MKLWLLKKLMRFFKTTGLRQLGVFLYKVGCEWGQHTKQSGAEEDVEDVL
jgi:hypothetical protein